MLRFSSVRLLGALALASTLAACARTDAKAAGQKVVASGGDVAPAPSASGMASGLTDSVSAQADRGRVRGASAAPIWIVEISDFQCPFCKDWHDKVFATIDRDYVKTGKVRLAYLNFPLSSIHRNAQAAAEAAMCASVQGKFWELHSSLFDTQSKWQGLSDPKATFDSLAVAAGVEPKTWRSCMTTHATAALITADHDRSQSAGVQSTPTFFIGSQKIEGALPLDNFRQVIDQELAKAGAPR
jgi:protein-disulfide isomerase